MENRLYVGNLPDDVRVETLRKRFSEFGEVSALELPTDRASGRLRGHAFVTMATAVGARMAIARLNGALFDERRLRVRVAGEDRDRSRPAVAELTRITLQFRERSNMVYELDCAGVPLVIKVFPQGKEAGFRVEATVKAAGQDGEARVLEASASSRALALEELSRMWTEQSTAEGTADLDWPAITKAMTAVRGI